MTRAVAAVSGVLGEQVNLRDDEVTVDYDPHRTTANTIADAIQRVGYHPHLVR